MYGDIKRNQLSDYDKFFNQTEDEIKSKAAEMPDDKLKSFAKEVYHSEDNSHPYKDNIITQEFYKRFGEDGWKELIKKEEI